MAKKTASKPRPKQAVAAPALAPIVTTSGPAAQSPADTVRTLRERVEGQESGRKSERKSLAGALARLEADYERVIAGRGGKRSVLSFTAVLDAQPAADAPVVATLRSSLRSPRQEVTFVPTPHDLVEAMLRMAAVTKDDVVYDLGCGDGRIVIAAASAFGAKGVGVDKDPVRIGEATENAAREGVSRRVKFVEADFFEVDVHDASVVMLYLLPSVNAELRTRLLEQLEPGARIVSHAFDMGDWQPAQKIEVAGRSAYLWIVPERETQG